MAIMGCHRCQWITNCAIGNPLSPLAIDPLSSLAPLSPIAPLVPLALDGDFENSIAIYFRHWPLSPQSPMATTAIGCATCDNECIAIKKWHHCIGANSDNGENHNSLWYFCHGFEAVLRSFAALIKCVLSVCISPYNDLCLLFSLFSKLVACRLR